MDTITSLRQVTEVTFVGGFSAKGGLKWVTTKSVKKRAYLPVEAENKSMFSHIGSSDQVHEGGSGAVSIVICQSLRNSTHFGH